MYEKPYVLTLSARTTTYHTSLASNQLHIPKSHAFDKLMAEKQVPHLVTLWVTAHRKMLTASELN